MKALICGSFDPVTLGHLSVIESAAKMFDEVVVGIFLNSAKKYMFSEVERLSMLSEAVAELKNVKVELCEGLVAAYVRDNGIDVIVKGVRNTVDCGYELEMARANRMIYPGCETIFIVSSEEKSGISSSLVRVMLQNGEDPSSFVPASVKRYIDKKCCE